MYFYSSALPGGIGIFEEPEKIVFENPHLTFACENVLDLSKIGAEDYDLGCLNPERLPVGIVMDIGLGTGNKRDIKVIHDAELLARGEKGYFPQWLKKRLVRERFSHELWLTFMAEETGLLRACLVHRSMIAIDYPCVHLAYRKAA